MSRATLSTRTSGGTVLRFDKQFTNIKSVLKWNSKLDKLEKVETWPNTVGSFGFPLVVDLCRYDIAIKTVVFGEGAERMVRKLRFASPGNKLFEGRAKMVCKESRFVDEEAGFSRRHDYHESFCRSQTLASEYAERFNEATKPL